MIYLLSFLLMCMPFFAAGDAFMSMPEVLPLSYYVVDDFEDGNFTENPEWWVFGSLSPLCIPNTEKKVRLDVGKGSLHLKGSGADLYIGGLGAFLGVDGERFHFLQLDVFGYGVDSGEVVIELIDDDNGTVKIETDPYYPWLPVFDDKFVYTQRVDWKGWRRLKIPLRDFVDQNPRVGDNIWNPSNLGGSGGLVQIQFLLASIRAGGSVNIRLDSIVFSDI